MQRQRRRRRKNGCGLRPPPFSSFGIVFVLCPTMSVLTFDFLRLSLCFSASPPLSESLPNHWCPLPISTWLWRLATAESTALLCWSSEVCQILPYRGRDSLDPAFLPCQHAKNFKKLAKVGFDLRTPKPIADPQSTGPEKLLTLFSPSKHCLNH